MEREYNKQSMSMEKRRWAELDDHGMVSFMVTLIMIVVISLIVLGFSQVTRRNQREALDRQLSSQAFYAAESGINVTVHAIQSAIHTGDVHAQNTCSGMYYSPATLDATSNTAYTCVLVDPTPNDLQATPTTTSSVVVPIFSDNPISHITFQWPKESGVTDNCTQTTQNYFPSSGGWTCGEGVLRVDLLQVPAGPVTADALSQNTVTLFMTPFGDHAGSGSEIFFPGFNRADVISGSSCSSRCQATVTLFPQGTKYYARLSMLYRNPTSPTIITATGLDGRPVAFTDSQAVVDVTGKAQDELRRIRARVNLTPTADSASIPLNALASSGDICKVYSFTRPSTDTVSPVTSHC